MYAALISWNYSLSDNAGFLLQRSTDSGSTWTTNYPLGHVVSYLDSDVISYGTYWYKIAATNRYGTGSFSNTGSVFILPEIPSAPHDLVVVSGSAILTWISGTLNEEYFAVQRSLDGVGFSDFAVTLVETYTDVAVSSSVAGNTYWYQVAAVDIAGTSSFSNTASITFIYDPPVGPITASVASGSALVSWTSSIANADVWHLYRSFNYGGFGYIGSFSPNTYSYRHEDVTASVEGNTYSYKVYAANSYGSSDYSNTASITFTYASPLPEAPISLSVDSGSAILNWVSQSNNQNYFAVQRSLDGLTYSDLASVTPIPTNIVTNGGFETGTTGSWTVVDLSNGVQVLPIPPFVYSGTYGLAFGPYVNLNNPNGSGSISQILPTTSGSSYNLFFWLLSNQGQTLFQLYWEGNLIADLSAVNNPYTQYTYGVTASMNGSELKFLGDNELAYYGLDDISVFPLVGGILPETYTDMDVSSSIVGNTYWYQVAGVNSYGTSSFSNTASIIFTIPLLLPTASFTGTPLSGAAPLAVTFTNASSNATIYNWSFGDAIFSSATNPVHTYTNPGVYDVGLMASGSAGVSYLTQSAYVSASSAPTLDPTLAWWTMDSGTANNELDSLNGTALATAYNPAWATTVAGKVNNALQFSCSAGVSVANVASDAALMSSGTGSTIVFWLNVTDDIPQGTNYVSLNYRFDQNATNYTTMIDRSGVAPNNWTVYVNGTPYITATSATGWHFFAITFDILTGTLGLDIDQAGMTTQAAIIPTAGANTTGRVYMGGSGGTVGSFLMQVDEFAVYNQVLTNTQLNYLYNSGTGRTWPVTLPP